MRQVFVAFAAPISPGKCAIPCLGFRVYCSVNLSMDTLGRILVGVTIQMFHFTLTLSVDVHIFKSERVVSTVKKIVSKSERVCPVCVL